MDATPEPPSQALGALPEDDTPVRRPVKKSRLVRLSTDQVLAHARGAEAVGAAAARRPVEGREARALAQFLGALGKWAEATEPRLTLANFVVDMQRAARCRTLRRELAERRANAFQLTIAGLPHHPAPDAGVPDADAPGPDPAPDSDRELCPPLFTPEQPPRARAADPLDMDVDPADATPPQGGAPRVAKALDMDVDPADAMPSATARPPDEGEDDYDLDLLREMDQGAPPRPAPSTDQMQRPSGEGAAAEPAPAAPSKGAVGKKQQEPRSGAVTGSAEAAPVRTTASPEGPSTATAAPAAVAPAAAAPAVARPRVAEPLDADVDLADVAPARPGGSAIERAAAAAARMSDSDDEADLAVLREFEEGG